MLNCASVANLGVPLMARQLRLKFGAVASHQSLSKDMR